jgi:membrane protein implicated in regulation of membrane protease activity
MNKISELILTMAGGSVSNIALAWLTLAVAFAFVILAGYALVLALNWHNVKDERPKATLTIDDAQ